VPFGQITGRDVLSAAQECPDGQGIQIEDPETDVKVPWLHFV
jgi:hypothetical protein